MNPGEYPQPLVRTQTVQFTAVSGYVGVRLRQNRPEKVAANARKTTFALQNTGNQAVTLQLVGFPTTSAAISGRANVGSAVTINPGGFTSMEVTPTYKAIDISCTGGNSTVRAQISSMVQLDIVPIDKNSQYYPPTMALGNPLPWASL